MAHKKPKGNPGATKERHCTKRLFTHNQGACLIPVQDGAPDGQEGVVNGQGVGDAVVRFDLDGLYRQANQVAHDGHQLEVAHEPPGGCRNLQRVANGQMICVQVLRAAFLCGDSALVLFLGMTFLEILLEE